MKITYKCADCGELLTVAAGEVKVNGDALFHVQPHECFPEIEASEPAERPWDAWTAPAREITQDGLDGTVSNTCMLCGAEAEHTGRDRIGQDSFKCSAEGCLAEFKETGLGPELLPCEFEKDAVYTFTCSSGLNFSFKVVNVRRGSVDIIILNEQLEEVFSIDDIWVRKVEESEFITVPGSVDGGGERIYPYCRKSIK